jgi:hypothetical protein
VKLFKLPTSILLLQILIFTAGSDLLSQTAGNFNFSVTTASTGGYSPNHLIAIWIEDNSPVFVKTRVLYSSLSNLDHLGTWISRSGSNTVDATSGATLTTHGTVSFIWNGTDISGNVVPDGTYNVWVEMAWASSLTTGKSVNSYSFSKGPAPFSSTPAGTTNLTGINLNWTPGSSAVANEMQNDDVRLFPNPTNGLLNIDFKKAAMACTIQVINDAGVLVYNERLDFVPVVTRQFDFSFLAPGGYYITLRMPGKDVTFRVIRMK